MDDMPSGTPWLEQPVTFHSSRMYECSLNHTEQCVYQQGYWRFWYEADHRYALPTVAFFMTTTILFGIISLTTELSPKGLREAKPIRKLVALNRYLSYRSLRINALDWNSAPLGILLLGAVGTIFFFSMTLGPKPYYWPNTHTLSYGDSPPLATRAGWMSLACLPFVFATAGKSNLITLVTGVSYDKLQVFHRWISYAMYVLALIHTFPFIVHNIWNGDMVEQWRTQVTYWTGVVALLAQSWLTFASFGPIRNLCYEWFKFSHFVAGLVFVVFFFIHCGGTLTSWDYFVATGALFSLSWLHRQLRIFLEHGVRHRANLSLVSNGFIRVRVPTHSTWIVGQHFFVRFMSLGGLHSLTTHPFSVCSLPKRVQAGKVIESELVFYIRPQGGFTARLAKYAEAHPATEVAVQLDGPYGGVDMRKLAASSRTLVIAGGSGAGWTLPLLTAFLRKSSLEPPGASSMRVILATRDMATQQWYETMVSELLSKHGQSSPDLIVEVYYTGNENDAAAPKVTGQFLRKSEDLEKAPEPFTDARSDSDISGAPPYRSDKVRLFQSRPDLQGVIAAEATSIGQMGSLGVFVCGPLGMQNDVAKSVASQQISVMKEGSKDIYLHMEHFSWA